MADVESYVNSSFGPPRMGEQAQPDQDTYYVLVCLECGGGDDLLPIPFESAEARGKWAAAHTKGTGHDRWLVQDQPRKQP